MSKRYHYEISLDSGTSAAKLLGLVGHKKNVLEIGCACGVQSKVLSEVLGCVVTGLEISKKAAEEAEKYCNEVITGDIEDMELEELLKGRKFDVVTFGDVLEHLKDPVKALKKVKPLLSDDGYIVASVPNIVHSSVIYQMMKGDFDYRENGLLDDTHIRFFTKKTVYQTFTNAGFFISSLERVIIKPEETEFNVVPRTEEDRAVLRYIAANNQESNTYQYVIKAYKADVSEGSFRLAVEKIREMEGTIKKQEAAIKTLESALRWVTSRRLYRIYSKATGLFGKRAQGICGRLKI